MIAAPLAIYPDDAYRDGVVVVTSSLRRAAADALPPQVKTLNYLTSRARLDRVPPAGRRTRRCC